MAAIDGLLNLLVAQGADVLTLIEGRVPELTRAGEPKPLSMPPLAGELMQRFIDEVRAAGGDRRYTFTGKAGTTVFEVEIEPPHRLCFRRADRAGSAGAAGGAARPQPEPAVVGAGAVTDEPPAASGRIAELIEHAIAAEATDLFVSTATDARMRVAGELHELPHSRFDGETLLALVGLDDARRERLEAHGSVDVGLRVHEQKLRVNLFRHRRGLAAAIRPLRRIRSLAELALPADLAALSELTDGLVLFVGPTGSGKSSTLAALLQHLNQTRSRHVVTIEDPVEFEYEGERCLFHQREVGRDVESFAAGLRAAMRESPDVILVGEMRDSETFAAALTAAETGHLVFSTLHSGNAAMAVDRIIDSFPPHQQLQVRGQLANGLRAVVTQMLLPGAQPGRLVPAVERLHVTHAVAHKIREGRGHQIGDDIQTGRGDGMVTLEASLADLVRRSQITLATARAAARKPDLLRELLQQ
jgi:twitching motility protein PilT